MTTAIETHRLSFRYGSHLAVDHLTLSVAAGEVFGFLGHNGAGKTTTVRLLNGILTPEAGEMRVLGRTPDATLRRQTGVLTETPSLDERLTGRENLRIYAALFDVPPAQVTRRVEDLLRFFELSERGDEKVGGYSKGMKQRLALARALLHEPQLLFLDEPTSGLDPVSSRQVHDLIQRLSREEGRTVFIATHNLNEAQRLCDRVAVMERGQLVASGTPAELARQIQANLRYEVEVDDGLRARMLLGESPDVIEATAETNLLHLTVGNREIMADLLARLVGAGVRVYQVTPEEASLEEIYFAIHEREVVR